MHSPVNDPDHTRCPSSLLSTYFSCTPTATDISTSMVGSAARATTLYAIDPANNPGTIPSATHSCRSPHAILPSATVMS